MFDRVVVSLDGSDTAERALPAATDLSRRLGVPLHLLRVADLAWLSLGANEAALQYASLGDTVSDEEQASRDYLTALQQRLATDGLTVTTEVRTGLAAREIIAAGQPGDLLVMASHGRGGPARWLLGSVAEDVARRAASPVLLIRADQAAQ
ncbi:MAG: universal stress protein [Chloroflexota bacterium]|nr:universal stress protein [Chloroflexota bacterium]